VKGKRLEQLAPFRLGFQDAAPGPVLGSHKGPIKETPVKLVNWRGFSFGRDVSSGPRRT